MAKVTLRRRAISKNRHTLYLDYYPPIPHPETGKLTRREFLSLYTFDKPKSPLDKQHNKETTALAESIKARRQLDIQNEQYGFLPSSKRHVTLKHYYEAQADKRIGSNKEGWYSSMYYLDQFFDESVKLSELTAHLCTDYREYLIDAPSQRKAKAKIKTKQQPISRNTAVAYFNKFKAVLKQAYKDGLLKSNLGEMVSPIKPAETERQYLTLEELQDLYNTECDLPVLKQAAIFSALTGLRFSDIAHLSWGQIQHSQAEGYSLHFRQQKTQGVEVLPISEQAVQLLGEHRTPEARVFHGLAYSAYNNGILRDWVSAAGIKKHITFHCFRHTYATLQLSLNTDIYTVSKMLGHRDLKTTQIYAKVMDKAKREAAGKIKLEI